MKGLLSKRNGIIAGAAVIIIIAAVVVSTSFSAAMNLDEAKEIAQKYVPASAKFMSSEEEDRYFEVAFYDEANKEHFEVEVIKETKEVKKVESQLSNDGGSKNITLTEEDAQKAVKNRFDGITSSSAILTKDNGLFEYEVSFKGDGFYGDADVNAESGVILDSVVKYGTAVTIPADTSKESEILTYEEAKNAVIKEAGGGTVRDMDLEKENGNYFYEIELHIDGFERDYIVNAKTGEVMLESEHECAFEFHHDDPYEVKEEYVDQQEEPVVDHRESSNGLISEEEAKAIVRAKIPGAEFVEFYLERDDGIDQYEGTAHLDGFEYEFEINAASGIIIDWDKERIEYDDDEWDD